MASTEKRCLYAVLGLEMGCSAEEIRSAYKKLALQRHPDKLIKSGLSEAEATASFQELSHAYEVLSDPKERSWYDSHRSQILFSSATSTSSSSVVPNLFSYFSNTVFSGYSNTKKGFYNVYSDLFNKVFTNEISYCNKLGLGLESVKEAPLMGDLDSPYAQVTAFYNFWLGFSTLMDFAWVDQYDALAGFNRKSRRVMEEENKKARKKARREYNETVRGLAEFVKKRDKRVIDMGVRRREEVEKRKEEERERKRREERERMERVSKYEEPEWARIDGDEMVAEMEEELEEKRNEEKELYCVVCSKKFKSEKQWKNHEQSKKHREKVAEFRESFVDEDEEREGDFEELPNGKEEELGEDNVEVLGERLKEGLGIGVNEDENGVGGSGDDIEEDDFFDVEEGDQVGGDSVGIGDGGGGGGGEDHDEEMSVLETMVSGHKNRRKNVGLRHDEKHFTREVHVEDESKEEAMRYNNMKSTRRNRRAKKERPKKSAGGDTKADVDDNKGGHDKENNRQDNSHMEESLHSFIEKDNNSKRDDDRPGKKHEISNQPVDRKENARKDTLSKSKNSSKGKKTKRGSNMCDTCGEEFDSRNKLHKHLGDTGHASLKYR
ncbi:DnaJ domain-containing protein/zf-C2H2_jaz domain-containing protein/zf-C2H2_2 domain-containing protein [Cephalotus follicularis]|uniref:DnaJ domain-containing protein/zf-C2H2_jaz domain-containing protein/zf-C2H2_2 domain-containing protein n=1 Tax=Cephalotus follicularis TaxID=3775 RepID=A0A1Q3D6A4_CEPFO|nr:DnaJ domain-containing protein/zf-C2H2_jaz domain-containing protein/zf-C2H2_2 domain-containing protein [Cephalotus follicularis]